MVLPDQFTKIFRCCTAAAHVHVHVVHFTCTLDSHGKRGLTTDRSTLRIPAGPTVNHLVLRRHGNEPRRRSTGAVSDAQSGASCHSSSHGEERWAAACAGSVHVLPTAEQDVSESASCRSTTSARRGPGDTNTHIQCYRATAAAQ